MSFESNKQLNDILDINLKIAEEQDIDKILEMILTYTKKLTNSDGGSLYIVDEKNQNLIYKITQNDKLNINLKNPGDWAPIPLYKDDKANTSRVAVVSALENKFIKVDDIYNTKEYDFSGSKAFDERHNYKTKSMLALPLTNHENEVIGVIQLFNKLNDNKSPVSFTQRDENIIKIFAKQASMILTNAQLVKSVDDFMNAFVNVIAKAIDDKSSQTNNHITNIAQLAPMIAQSINDDSLVYANVNFSQNDIKQIELAAKLHDVGKITTPDYILEKSSKLECIYDRFEAVKDRFEILKRDAKIEFLENKITQEQYDKKITQLKSDLEFIDTLNKSEDLIESARLDEIASKTYLQDDKICPIFSESEIENLKIKRGNLTKNELEKIKNHAQLSKDMLKNLPYPKKYKDVLHIAINHHEKLNGKGYPSGLAHDELDIKDKILILADIFEALTAQDRSYKSPKTLKKTFEILDDMAFRGEIDKDLLEFFKTSDALKEYAKRLQAGQIDDFFK
ncbi:HD domain-containing phosphohydrolase [Campylobacter gastrosuis]|uniref:HD domain-containing protein n=1 Tax=Campylobacter gastrosuis TaxID=2974576 RepID=A0ABT7HTB1_9BACT|nr:HD domain-containing phosphohydrolase [Campylobacter gastrosuis]MDL0089648.1 HD domain-containing protein [Campylobacter gastrosuis]